MRHLSGDFVGQAYNRYLNNSLIIQQFIIDKESFIWSHLHGQVLRAAREKPVQQLVEHQATAVIPPAEKRRVRDERDERFGGSIEGSGQRDLSSSHLLSSEQSRCVPPGDRNGAMAAAERSASFPSSSIRARLERTAPDKTAA
jgi:hypothetical protein